MARAPLASAVALLGLTTLLAAPAWGQTEASAPESPADAAERDAVDGPADTVHGAEPEDRPHGSRTGARDGSGDGAGDGAGDPHRPDADLGADSGQRAAPRHGLRRGRSNSSGPGAGDGTGRRATANLLGEHGSRSGASDRSGPGASDGTGRKDDTVSHGSGTGRSDARGRGDGDGSGKAAASTTTSPFDLNVLDSVQFVPNLQYRLRYRHHEGHDFTSGTESDTLRHRARLGISGMWANRVGAFVQLQDVRTFGEEFHTVEDVAADGLDVHQAFASFLPYRNFEIRIGRQEIMLANQRLVGAQPWEEPGRSLDALRFRYRNDDITVDSFYALVRESAEVLGIDAAQTIQGKQHLAGGMFRYTMMPEFRATLIGVSERKGDDGKRLHTIGGLFDGDFAKSFHYGVEGYYQFGSAYGGINYSSFLASADARVTLDLPTNPYVEAGATVVSGDDTPDNKTVTSFAADFGSHHRFSGEMDFFADLPADTDERGLRDVATAIGIKPLKGLHARVSHHLFQAMATRADGLEHFGHELDIKVSYRFWKYGRLAAAYAVFFPGTLKENEFRNAEAEQFMYTTAEVSF